MAAWTSVRTSGLTRGEPLTTRETVARETPAMWATSSRVVFVRRLRPPAWVTVTPSAVRALSRLHSTLAPHVKRALSRTIGDISGVAIGRRTGPRQVPGGIAEAAAAAT